MLCADPSNRSTLDKIELSKWVQGPVPSYEQLYAALKEYKKAPFSKPSDLKTNFSSSTKTSGGSV